jgi:GNAT superfamily N-acetyltransferase
MTDRLELHDPASSAQPADDIVIRPATAADRDFLLSLDDRLIAEAAAPGLTRDHFVAFQSRYTKAALDAADATTLIAEEGAGTPLGYIHLEPTEDGLSGAKAGYVSILAVRAEAEGRGIGKRLIQEAEHWAAARAIAFCCSTSSQAMRRPGASMKAVASSRIPCACAGRSASSRS